jgi:glucosamine-6-phosphate deaminase
MAMEIVIRDDAAAAVRLCAQLVAHALRSKPDLVLGLATGHTMIPVYRELVRLHCEEGLDFSLCRTFNLDEYVGLPPEHPNSYNYFMAQHLFDHINIDRRNTHIPNGMASELRQASQAYEAMIEDVGGIDLQLLGIGAAGHIGFNEPLSALLSRTRDKALSPATIAQHAPDFAASAAVPKWGITMGVGTILESRRCILLATGSAKAEILSKAVEGPITAMVSASALQLHPNCQVIVDEAAAAELQGTAYYRWIFAHEPQWAPFRDTAGN